MGDNDKCFDEPFGLQKLRECSMVAISQEWGWWNSTYVVSSHDGVLCKARGSHHYRMTDTDDRLIMGLNFKRPWFESAYMLVQVLHCPAVKVCVTSALGGRSLVVTDEKEQPVLQIKQSMMSNTIKILATNDVEIGRMKKEWGDWNVQFPADLEIQYKAALIGACIFYDLRKAEHRRRETNKVEG